MVKLRCFGALTLSGEGTLGTSAGQTRRLALLAVLAVFGERGATRDSVLALLWPDSEEGRARQALSQALYALRRDLGEAEAVVGQRDLRLNDAVVSSDVQRFLTALETGDDESAVQQYGGEFLEGVHVGAGDVFERWVDDQRARFARDYLAALERLARRAQREGNATASLAWWRKLTETDPLNTRFAAETARAFAALGDRASAVRHLREHIARLRTELEVDPDPSLLALCAQLERAEVKTFAETTGLAERPSHLDSGVHEPTHASVSSADVPRRTTPPPPVTLSTIAKVRRPWARNAALVAVMLVAVFIAGALIREPASSQATTSDESSTPRSLVIAPLDFVGPANESFKSEAVAYLLESTLSSIPGLDVHLTTDSDSASLGDSAPGRAKARNAPRLSLSGTVVGASGGAISATLALTQGGSDSTTRIRATNAHGNVGALADDLARALIGALGVSTGSGDILAAASGSTRSLSALQFFVDGEEAFTSARWKEAQDAFTKAVRADSTFAMAYYRLSEAANWNADGVVQIAAAMRAHALREGLPLRARLLVEAYYAWNRGDANAAEAGYRDATSRFPRDIEAWYQLGEVLFHSGPIAGRPLERATHPYEMVVSLSGTSKRGRRLEALLHLTRIAGRRGDRIAFDSLETILRPLLLPSDVVELNTLAACVRGAPVDVARMSRDLATAGGLSLSINAERCAIFGASLPRAISLLEGMRHVAIERQFQVGRTVEEAALRAATGDWAGASHALGDESAGEDAPSLLVHRALIALQDPTAANGKLRALRDSLDAGFPRGTPRGLSQLDADFGFLSSRFSPYVSGLLSLRFGDTSAASRQVQRQRSIQGDSALRDAGYNLSLSLLAHLALARGRPADVLVQLDSMRALAIVPTLEYMPFRAAERLVRSRALFDLGRFRESSEAAMSIGERHPFEYYFVPAAAAVAQRAMLAAGLRDSASVMAARYRVRGIRY